VKRRRALVQADDAQQGARKRARLEARAQLKAGRAARRRAANPDGSAEPDDLDAPGTGELPPAADPAVSPPESAATQAETGAARPPAPPPGDGDDDGMTWTTAPCLPCASGPTRNGAASSCRAVAGHPFPKPMPRHPAPWPPTWSAVAPARPQRRHRAMLASFVLLVLLPFLLSGAYLWGVAQDQYASTFAFSVRKEETQSSLDIIGGITQLAGSATSDTDILYEFIRSQDLVARVNAELDLRSIWSRAWPDDPVFGFDPSGTIEDLHAHWLRKLDIAYDAGTGIVTLRVLAFDPVDARNIATAISR
jgi:capsular polysaccharide transport system permease protein